MGETQLIPRQAILALAKAANISAPEVEQMIERFATVATSFSALCNEFFNQEIRPTTIKHIQQTLNRNLAAIRS